MILTNMQNKTTYFNIILLIFSTITLSNSIEAQTKINEILASNQLANFDDFFESDDWIEIYHEGPILNLAGYYLSDRADSLTKWQFPIDDAGTTTVLPGGHKIVWLDNDAEQGADHATFKLSPDGEGVYLTQPDGTTVVDSVTFPQQQTDISYGRECDGCEEWIYFNVPTFEGPNAVSELTTPILYINEVLISNTSNLIDENFEADAWVEIYNPNSFQVNLGGYTFSTLGGDSYTVLNSLPWETTVAGEGFLLFWLDGDMEQGGHHLGIVPNISSGTLTLTGPDNIVADMYNYEVALANNSWGRVTDGSPTSSWFSTPTPRVSNTLLIIPPAPIVINELMSSNLLDTTDASGIHEDWFEIVNTSEYPVDLAGYYVTDRLNDPMKYQFPLGIPDSTVIDPGGYVLIYADEDNSEGWNHTNFKFNSSGEVLVLRSVDGFSISDSVHFPALSLDNSWGRDIDQTGDWRVFEAGETTPEYCNVCTSSISDDRQVSLSQFVCYPNPVAENTTITVSHPSVLYDLKGRVVQTFKQAGIYLINVPSGVYFLQQLDANFLKFNVIKLVVE
jgi:hypothetical protein